MSSYEELATTSLLTLHMEIRCQMMYHLRIALSPETAPYLLEQDVTEPDPQILSLNGQLVGYDETVVRFLRVPETAFVRRGLGRLVDWYLVANASLTAPMNAKGCGRMQLNILVLQQNLKNIEDGVDLARAANYYTLFERGPDAVVDKAREQAAAAAAADAGGEGDGAGAKSAGLDPAEKFSYDELKAVLELWYSEQLANPERGISAAAKRQLNDKLLGLSEHLWQN